MIGELAALGAAICWTVSAVLYKEALLKANPLPANIVRCVYTSIVLVVCLAIIGKFGVLMDLSLHAVILTSVSGIVGLGFGDTLYMVSLKLMGIARAVPITCSYPLFNLLLAVVLAGEAVTLYVILGTVAIVLGIWLLSREEKETGTSEPQKKRLIRGVASALATAIFWSVSLAMINMAINLPETSSLDNALAINTIRVSAAAFFLLASTPITDRKCSFLKIHKKRLIALISGGIVALALGWFLLTFSFIHTPQSQAVPISSTTPLFATVSGIVFLHEKVAAREVVGSIMIVIGIFLIFTV